MLLRKILVPTLLLGSAAAQTLTDESFAPLLEQVLPCDEELAWRAIPWGAELGRAALRADAEGKPVLLWAMNGHPLGCT